MEGSPRWEDPLSRIQKTRLAETVGFAYHHVLHQAGKGYDPGFGLAPAKEFCPSYIPGRQIAQCPFSRVFEFHLLPFSRLCAKARMSSTPCLNARLFIGGDHKVVGPQGKSVPHSLIKVQNPAGLLLKLRVPGKDPTPVLPRLNGILSQPSPDGGTAHVGNNASLYSFPGNFPGAPSRQRNAAFRGQLTRQGLYPNDDVRGKNRTAVRVWVDLPAPQGVRRKTVSSTCSLSVGAGPASVQLHRFPCLEQPSELPWPGSPNNKVTYIFSQSSQALPARQRTAQFGTDSFSALNPPWWRRYAKDNKCIDRYHHNTSLYL